MQSNKRELLIKTEEETSEEHGCLPHKRSMEQLIETGIVNIDKTAGPTSHQVTAWVKNIFKAKKAGHSGTLDPNVTGCLPIGLNSATKVMQALLHSPKEYAALMHLHEEVSEKEIKKVMTEFVGKIYQTPPLKSAVKRTLRIREIYSIKIIEILDKDVLFRVRCEAGTYIRRLCHDIGLILGTGAHMQQLRRTKSGPFDESSITSLYTLKDAYHFWLEDKNEKELRKILVPMESALRDLPRVIISDNAVDSLCHGAQLAMPGILKLDSGISKNDLVGVFTQKGEAVLIANSLKSAEDILKSKKGFAVKTERVLMEPGTYPKKQQK